MSEFTKPNACMVLSTRLPLQHTEKCIFGKVTFLPLELARWVYGILTVRIALLHKTNTMLLHLQKIIVVKSSCEAITAETYYVFGLFFLHHPKGFHVLILLDLMK